MASGSIEDDSNDDLISRRRAQWTPHSKVYTRRIRNNVQETIDNSCSSATTTSGAFAISTATRKEVSPDTSRDPNNPVSDPPCLTKPGVQDASTVPIENPSCADVPVPVEALVTAEDVNSSNQRVQEGSACEPAELQKLEDSPLPSSDAARNFSKASPIHSTDELPKTNGNGTLNLRITSSLSSENDLSNAREVETAELPVRNDLQGDGELVPVPTQVLSGIGAADANGNVKPLVISNVEDRIRFHLSKVTSKNEIDELRKRLECELDQVRRLVKELEAKEIQISSYNTQISDSNISNYVSSEVGTVGGFGNSQPLHAPNNVVDRRVLLRVNTNVGSITNLESRPIGLARMSSDVGAARNLEVRPYSRQLSVAVIENNQRPGEFVEKEKRTPKANQFYRKSEFLLAKDRLPPESNKRLKTNKGRKHRGESEYAFGFGFGFGKRAIKSCSSLLQRLMKHNHGWVFNEPVNAKALGLHDYHDIIKHPMDLGTIKTRLSQKWYKSPREFAEDVRLVFRNAMTYNPKGQDVHFMAEQLSQIFEERWQILETEYNPYWKYQMYLDAGLPTPKFRKAAPQSHFGPTSALGSAAAPFPALVPSYAPAPVATPTSSYAPDGHMRSLDRPDLIATPMAFDPIIQRPFIGRTPAPKKPKAKDPDKRDMTYDEKQKLSTNLQSLPTEKLDAIVQIIKRRTTALSQNDDEIEVDIDRVDTETLWELDRFVTNYKKSLSKYRRKAELARQARMVANQRLALMDTTPASADVQIGNGAVLDKSIAPLAAEGETKENSASRSSSSSSSSSDSGSSSSDSDSDSSSSDGSDEGDSPKT